MMDPIERVRLELATRKLIIMMLGVMTVLVGAMTIMTGAPAFIEDWFSPWSRVVLGLLAFVPGLMVSIGGAFDDSAWCVWWIQIFGLAGVAAWYAAMAGAYTGLVIRDGPGFVKIGHHLASADAGRAYVPLIYIVLFIITAIPLVTMFRIGKPDKLR